MGYNLTVSAPGYYAVGARFATCSTCGRALVSIPDSQITAAVEAKTYTAGTPGYTYVQVGGYQLSAGTHTVLIEFPDAIPEQPTTIKLDYVTLAQIQGGAYGDATAPIGSPAPTIATNLAKAFNNDGISSEGGIGASLEPATGGETGHPQRGFSQQTLAQLGIFGGQNYLANFADSNGNDVSATFSIPNSQASNGYDNVIAAGQHIRMPAETIANHVDLLVAAACGNVVPDPRTEFDLVHQEPGGSTVTTHRGLPNFVPFWLESELAPELKPITSTSYVSGTSATPTPGSNSLYVIEIDVEEERRAYPITEVTLPSTGASLVQNCSAPELHVLAMTTR